MAVSTLATIASLVQKVYRGSLAITLQEKSQAYQRLQELGKIRTDIRNEYRWPVVEEGSGAATNISDGETLPAASIEEYTDAVLYPKIFIKMIRVGRMLKLGSTNKAEFYAKAPDALKHQINRAIPQMARTIHTQIVATTAPSTKALTGLGDAIGSTTNTYAGINRTAATYWQPYVNHNSGTNRTLSVALLNTMYDTLTDSREADITEVWCGVTAFNSLCSLLGPTYINMNNTQPQEIHGGILKVWWKDIPFIRMPGMDSNTMYWLDFEEGIEDEGIELVKQHEDDILVREEATNSYDDRISIAGHYQMICHNPWKQGTLKDVN